MQRQRLLLFAAALSWACEDPATPAGETDGPATSTTDGSSESGVGPEDTDDPGDTDPGVEPRCGDGVIDPGEACDLGIGNAVGAECTPACAVPACGDGELAPSESCDGDLGIDDFAVAPAGCSDDCAWIEPTRWRDEWGAHPGHDDEVTRVRSASDGSLTALGWQRDDVQTDFLRRYEPGGAVAWTADLGPRACGVWGPQLAVRPQRAVVLTESCDGGSALVRAFGDDGASAWSLDLEETGEAGVGLWPTSNGFVSYVASLDGGSASLRLVAFDDAGEIVWSIVPEDPLRAAASDDDVVYGVSTERLWSRNLADGSLIASVPVRSRSARMVLDTQGRPVVARRPTNAMEPFVLEAFETDLELAWSVPFPDLPNIFRDTYGLDAHDGRIAVAFEENVEGLGPFDTAAAVHVYDETGSIETSLVLQGPDHGRDAAHDVAFLAAGELVVGGAFSRAFTGRDGFVAQLDEDLATTSAYVAPHRTEQGPEPLERPDGAVPKTLFVDVSGAFLRPGSDPVGAELTCIDGAFGFPAFGWSPAEVEQALVDVRAVFAPFAVRVVLEEPPSYLPYTRVVVGGAPEELGSSDGHQGLACSVDCEDQAWSEAVFVFGETAPSPAALAQTIAHELGHAIGLDHVDAADALMSPTSSEGNVLVEDVCHPTTDPVCGPSHGLHCSGGAQNSYAEFLAAVGPASSDDQAPVVALSATDAVIREPVQVEVEVSDETPGFGWELRVVELGWASRGQTSGGAAFDLDLPAGVWTLEVEAMDQHGNAQVEAASVRVD